MESLECGDLDPAFSSSAIDFRQARSSPDCRWRSLPPYRISTQSAAIPAREFLRSRLRSLRDARFHSGVCRSSSSVLRIGGDPSIAGRGVVDSTTGNGRDSRSRWDFASNQDDGCRCGFCWGGAVCVLVSREDFDVVA